MFTCTLALRAFTFTAVWNMCSVLNAGLKSGIAAKDEQDATPPGVVEKTLLHTGDTGWTEAVSGKLEGSARANPRWHTVASH